MRIAMIGHKHIPGRTGGVEVVVEELSTKMVEYGHHVTVYNRKYEQYKDTSQYKGVRCISVPTVHRKSTEAVVSTFLSSILALFGHYDVIHYHALGPSLFLIIPHIFGLKTVVTVHGLNYKTPKWKGIGGKFIRLGELITAKYADKIIVLSKDQQLYFKKKYGSDSIYIPNGVTLQDKIAPNIIKYKYGLKKNGYILFLSRLVPGKGIEYLIDAYKQIKTDLPLIIAGDAPYVSSFINNIKDKANADKRVRFIGFVEGNELQELYSNAKIFVFPSEAEGMPICLLEAMSYDVPCLVSDIPENLEVGQDFVWKFHNKDINDLKDKLNYLINCESISVKSRNYIKERYNWKNVTEKTLDVYRMINSKKTS